MNEESKLSADGLEVVAWVTTGFSGKYTRRALTVANADADQQRTNWLPHYKSVTTDALCRLTDAQRLLSQLREELAQRDAEIERLNGVVSRLNGGNAELCSRVRELEHKMDYYKALESQQAASLDAAAERNAMQRQRDDAKKLLVRECDDADELVRLLGLDPEAVRTDGGFLNLAAVRSMLAASVGDDHGPDYPDGHDWQGFPGGCERMGCKGKCAARVGGELAAFESWAQSTPQGSQLRYVRDALPVTDPRYGEYISEALRLGWESWQARAALSPVGGGVLGWAIGRWHAEVSQRPLVNVHRRALDGTWRQIIQHLGGDPDALCGPSHDELMNAKPQANSQEGSK